MNSGRKVGHADPLLQCRDTAHEVAYHFLLKHSQFGPFPRYALCTAHSCKLVPAIIALLRLAAVVFAVRNLFPRFQFGTVVSGMLYGVVLVVMISCPFRYLIGKKPYFYFDATFVEYLLR